MTVHVEACWGGGDIYHRLRFRHGKYARWECTELIRCEVWDRKAASEALDLLERVYGVNRRSVRFSI